MLQVITRLIVGGAQLTVRGLCESLRDEFEVQVVCGPEAGSEGSILEDVRELVDVTVLPELRRDIDPRSDVKAYQALRLCYARLSPDIVHTHSSKAGIVGRLAAGRVPAVAHTVHGWGHTPADSPRRRRTLVGLERVAARRTDALLAVSADVREEGLRQRIGKPKQYWIVPAYVNYRPVSESFEEARREARYRLGLAAPGPVIGWVGRFVPQKDPLTLAGALSELLQEPSESTRAVLVGDGPMRNIVEDRLRPFGERVLFAGRRADARFLYAAFDVLIHPSLWEGQPMVLQEAVAERIPVVACRAPGVTSIVLEGRTGYIVEPGDRDGLVERARAALADARLGPPLSPSAVADVAESNGHEVCAAGHARIYSALLRGADRSPRQ